MVVQRIVSDLIRFYQWQDFELFVDFCFYLLNFFVFDDVMEEYYFFIFIIDNNIVLYRDNILFVLLFFQKLLYNRDSIIMIRGFQ